MKWEAKCQTQPDNPQCRSQNPLEEKEKSLEWEQVSFLTADIQLMKQDLPNVQPQSFMLYSLSPHSSYLFSIPAHPVLPYVIPQTLQSTHQTWGT